MNDLQKKILEVFFDTQCSEDTGYVHDECNLVTYMDLEDEENGIFRKDLKPVILEMRNNGIIRLETAIDYEYSRPCGSGYLLTEKGEKIVKELFITPTEHSSNKEIE